MKLKKTDSIFKPLRSLKRAGHSTAIVAGGAIRDKWHEVAIRDVDIFVQYPLPEEYVHEPPHAPFSHSSWTDYWSKVFSGNDIKISSTFSSYDDPGSKNNDHPIIAVWSTVVDGNIVQIIFTKIPPIEYVEDFFDFGICKAYSDGNRICLSSEFMQDSMNKTITMCEKNMPPERARRVMENHLPRIKAKYPDFTPIIPANLKEEISIC